MNSVLFIVSDYLGSLQGALNCVDHLHQPVLMFCIMPACDSRHGCLTAEPTSTWVIKYHSLIVTCRSRMLVHVSGTFVACRGSFDPLYV